MRIVCKTVKRMTNEILGVKGLNETGISYQHGRELGNRIGQQHMHTWENYDTLQHSLMIKNEGGIQLNV